MLNTNYTILCFVRNKNGKMNKYPPHTHTHVIMGIFYTQDPYKSISPIHFLRLGNNTLQGVGGPSVEDRTEAIEFQLGTLCVMGENRRHACIICAMRNTTQKRLICWHFYLLWDHSAENGIFLGWNHSINIFLNPMNSAWIQKKQCDSAVRE